VQCDGANGVTKIGKSAAVVGEHVDHKRITIAVDYNDRVFVPFLHSGSVSTNPGRRREDQDYALLEIVQVGVRRDRARRVHASWKLT